MQFPSGAGLEHCWIGFEGLGRCAKDGNRVRGPIPRPAGGKTSTAPSPAVLDVSRLPKGPFRTRMWVTSVDGLRSFEEKDAAAPPQHLTLEKP